MKTGAMGPPLRGEGESAARQLEGRSGTSRTFCRRETGDRVRVRGPHLEKSRKSWVWGGSEKQFLLIKVAKGPGQSWARRNSRRP